MNIKVSLIIDGENFDDIPCEKQLEAKNSITDKVEAWASQVINKRIESGICTKDIEKLLGV